MMGDEVDKQRELFLTNDPEANALLAEVPLAFLVGLVLHQQIPTEKAFHSPLDLRRRIGRELDAVEIADMDPERLEAMFKEKPALHRFPGSMAKRVQTVCAHLTEEYGGSVPALWHGVGDANDLMSRLLAIPGFSEYKARIYLGVLGRRFGVQPSGWEELAPTWPSIADVSSPEDLADLRVRKKHWKESQQ